MFGLWTIALVFVTIFVEISVAAKSPRFAGPYHPGIAINLIIRVVLLVVMLFFGLGQYFCILTPTFFSYLFFLLCLFFFFLINEVARSMMSGDKFKKCMPMGVADLIMVNFISHIHIFVRHFLFNRTYQPERPV